MPLRLARRVLTSVVWLTLASATAVQAQAVDVFNPGADYVVFAMALQPDGKIVVGGAFSTLGGGGTTSRSGIGRLNADGSVDATFNPGAAGNVLAIAIQPDGKIVVGGDISGLGGGTGVTPRSRIGRLNADGSVDATFNPGANGQVAAIALQPDGKILVGGSFTGLGGGTGTTVRNHIGRLNADGSVDSAFDPGATNGVNTIAVQADGKILVGGYFTGLGGGTGVTGRLEIGRLESDGTVDPAFNPGASGAVNALVVQGDGKIVVGGSFLGLGSGNGSTPRNFIGRLNADGSLDASFDPQANGAVITLALQADDRILAGGSFTTIAATTRNRIGRINSNGSLDATFDPGATSSTVYALTIQPDGKVLIGGLFTGLGGGTGTTARASIGRVVNTSATTQKLAISGGGSVVTWSRNGPSPELTRVEFASSIDGITYTALGNGTRLANGWELSGLSLPANPNLTIRARGFYSGGYYGGSSSIAEFIAPPDGANFIENGDFGTGTTSWLQFATPDLSYIVANETAGVFQFYRRAPPAGTPGQAVAFQNTGIAIGGNAPLTAQFSVGNTDAVRKRISVLVHDSSFADLSVCTFWLPANAPLATYSMRTHTTRAWSDATISFYAASANVAGNTTGFYQIDNVSLSYVPSNSVAETTCVDPHAPTPPGGAIGPDLLTNGGFATGFLSPWTTFGTITGAVTGGVFEFIKPSATLPAGVVLQATTQAMTANQILTATFELGNSSAVRKRVTVILHDNNFSDLSACTFWLAPGQALATYTYRTYATQAWTNATLSVYPATVGADSWIRLDTVTLQRTPGAALVGTLCIEPGGTVPDAPLAPALRPGGLESWRPRDPEDATRDTLGAELGDGFVEVTGEIGAPGSAWIATGTTNGRRVLTLGDPIDLTNATTARLRLRSWLTSAHSRAEIQLTTDGVTWETVHVVAASDTWVPLDIDLATYLGETISVRFVFDGVEPTGSASPDSWWVEAVGTDIEPGAP